ncbi:MAG: HPr(Ser) kinase/phosphatase [Oscillospiraceae bacterium]|jgi:HPr kinase/phosphorylase|nr:HPr(Ser) kinase/phosphatase [Oscillospiraceae bacterium]
MISAQDFVDSLGLQVLVPSTRKEWDIRTSDLNRPGLQFVGYYDYFAYERPQVVGKTEMSYLESLEPDVQRARLEKYLSFDIPCVVIARGMACPSVMAELAAAHNVPVYQTMAVTTRFFASAIIFLNSRLAPRVTRHGVLVDVFGVGVLLTGESGVGKSEAALELVKRGHQLVADDVVDICRVSENRLVGEAPEMVRHFMEIRGLGIIDIRAMYGVGAVVSHKSIDIVIHLELWRENKEYDRLGLSEEYITIMGAKLPYIVMPVRPGRNLAIIIEVAARNWRLKRMGYNAAAELDGRLTEMLQRSREGGQPSPMSEED